MNPSKTIRKQALRWSAVVLVAGGMGISLPQCPGQQAMQQQVDSLITAQGDMTRKLQKIDGDAKAGKQEIDQFKQILQQMKEAMDAQQKAMTELGAKVTALEARPVYTPPAAKGGKAGAKKKK